MCLNCFPQLVVFVHNALSRIIRIVHRNTECLKNFSNGAFAAANATC